MNKTFTESEQKAIELLKTKYVASRDLCHVLDGKKGRVKMFIQKIESSFLLAEDNLPSGETVYKIIKEIKQ